MIGRERNKRQDEPVRRTVTTGLILKDRGSGEADGSTYKLKYSRENGRLEEYTEPDDLPKEI